MVFGWGWVGWDGRVRWDDFKLDKMGWAGIGLDWIGLDGMGGNGMGLDGGGVGWVAVR